MKKPHVIEELSAYIDGEAREPQRIAQHLQSCPTCARRHLELLKLGVHLRALPLPRTQPEFAANVMRRVAAAADHPSDYAFSRRLRLIPLAACMLLFASVAAFLLYRLLPAENSPAVPLAVNAYESDDAVITAMEQLLEKGETLDIFEISPVEREAEQPLEAVITALAEAADGEAVGEGGLGEWEVNLDTLGDDEAGLFRQLLLEYSLRG